MQVKRKISGLPAVDLVCSLVVILFITCYPYIKMGLSGYFPDLMYHLLRIEAVKDSLMHGEYPAKIYTMFYGGYGYGSPLFYPDILLTIPALFRMVGVDPILTWKLFSAIICLAASLSTFFL